MEGIENITLEELIEKMKGENHEYLSWCSW